MSSAHFEDFFSKTGEVGSTNVNAILLALNTAGLIATPEQLQNALDTLGYADALVLTALDMARLFAKLSAEIGVHSPRLAADVDEGETSGGSVVVSDTHGASDEDDLGDATLALGMTLVDLEVACAEKSWNLMQSLPQRVKCVVVV